MTDGDRGRGGDRDLFRPPGADAAGAGGADVLRPGAAGRPAQAAQAGQYRAGGDQPGAGAGDPDRPGYASWARNSPSWRRNCRITRPISHRKFIRWWARPRTTTPSCALNQTATSLADQITGANKAGGDDNATGQCGQADSGGGAAQLRGALVGGADRPGTAAGAAWAWRRWCWCSWASSCLQKDDLRDRFVRLAGSGDMQRTTVALEEAASRLSRYLFLQTVINACFGLVIGTGLWLIGIPNAPLWAAALHAAALCAVCRRAAGLFVSFHPGAGGGSRLDQNGLDAGAVWRLEAFVGQGVEPFLYGRSVGLSAVAVVVAAVFWTWLWGPVGLLLSTPLTMCFRRVQPACRRAEIPGRDAGRPAGAARSRKACICVCWRKTPTRPPTRPRTSCAPTSLSAYYDEVAARALMLAQTDVNRGVLDPLRQARIRDAIKGLIVNLSDRKDEDANGARSAAALARARRFCASPAAARWTKPPPCCWWTCWASTASARGWCRPTKPRPPISANCPAKACG